jgi:hypothetical protein
MKSNKKTDLAFRNYIFIILVLLFFLTAGCQTQLMPTPNLYIDSDYNPLVDVKHPKHPSSRKNAYPESLEGKGEREK